MIITFLLAFLQSFALLGSFQYLLLKDLGDKGVVMGLAALITTLTEGPMFLMGDRIIQYLVRF